MTLIRLTLAASLSTALSVGLAAAAFAQGTTQIPPSPNSSQSAPMAKNSVPLGAATTARNSAGGGNTTRQTRGRTHARNRSLSTHNSPSRAFSRTVPKPAVKTKP